MYKNNKQSVIKATIRNIIVAFVYVAIICAIIYVLSANSISRAISLIDMISVDTNVNSTDNTQVNINKNIVYLDSYKQANNIDEKTKDLKNYPEYGNRYGNIELPTLNLDLPLYFGDTLEILKNGVGHSSLSYFPGEGGTILCMGHNTWNILKKLPQIKLGDNITINTTYGKFLYEVYDMKIVDQYELEAAPLQRDKEILMLYTCYPVTGIGHATQRFFVYANLVEANMF